MNAFRFLRSNAVSRDIVLMAGNCSKLQHPRTTALCSKACRLYYTKPHNKLQRSSASLLQNFRSSMLRRFREVRHNGTNGRPTPDPTPHLGSPEPSLSLSQRMRKLSREYGWSALGVYFALSALDFPFCFLAVRMLGTDRIGHWEYVIVSTAKDLMARVFPQMKNLEAVDAQGQVVGTTTGEVPDNWGVEKATKEANSDDATIWTQLVLAYAIHKSFIFIRVPITAAITPKVVKTLRGWGWDIGKRRPKTGNITSKKD